MLANIVEFMQREFSLSEGGSVAASATQLAQNPEGVEDAASGTGENQGASSSGGAADGRHKSLIIGRRARHPAA